MQATLKSRNLRVLKAQNVMLVVGQDDVMFREQIRPHWSLPLVATIHHAFPAVAFAKRDDTGHPDIGCAVCEAWRQAVASRQKSQ